MKNNNWSIFSIINIIILFFNNPSFSQNKPDKQGMNKIIFDYGVIIKLKINEKIQFEDSLSILLISFSHKRPYTGGATKATAHLSLVKGDISEKITLSIRGIEGKSELEDGLSDSERFETQLWKEHKIQLRRFNYDESIEIIVSKEE